MDVSGSQLLIMACSVFLQRLTQSSNVESESAKLATESSTLQATATSKDRALDPEKKKMTTKVEYPIPEIENLFLIVG
jgi:hypothetical protein